MIAKIFPLMVLLILLPDLYLYFYYYRRNRKAATLSTRCKRILWWLPGLFMLGYTISLSLQPSFAPVNADVLSAYLVLFGLLVATKVVYALSSFIGHLWCRRRHLYRNYGNLVGFLLSLFIVFLTLYSYFVTPCQLQVRRETFVFNDLPAAFNGYRIVQFTDAHVGSIPHDLLERAIDSINAQHPDLIIFTGDLQNIQPGEIDDVAPLLSRLQAKDGVYSILGNHDYSFYLRADEATSRLNEAKMIRKQNDLGWHLLLNEHAVLRRGSDSIFLTGMENESLKAEQTRSDLQKTMQGIPQGAFVLMLQHEPTAWRRTILPMTHAQLTLSGHTHGGQFMFFGWTPVQLTTAEWGGVYREGTRILNVSSGLGGLVPFRYGVIPEFAVITLIGRDSPHTPAGRQAVRP